MLELGVGADIVRGVGIVIWGVFAAALIAALAVPKGWKAKSLWTALVLAIFIGPAIPSLVREIEHRQRYARAKALFDKKCKASGERINEKIRNVDGILLMKARPSRINFGDQFALDDPYGRDFGGDEYLSAYLMGRNADGTFTATHNKNAYRFVEFRDPKTGTLHRYTAIPKPRGVSGAFDVQLVDEPVREGKARYGVTWDDISTPEDRQNWIAGSRLQVVELQTGNVVAERVGYMFDAGLGDTRGGRSPWSEAEYHACPAFARSAAGHPTKTSRSRAFVLRALPPIQEN